MKVIRTIKERPAQKRVKLSGKKYSRYIAIPLDFLTGFGEYATLVREKNHLKLIPIKDKKNDGRNDGKNA